MIKTFLFHPTSIVSNSMDREINKFIENHNAIVDNIKMSAFNGSEGHIDYIIYQLIYHVDETVGNQNKFEFVTDNELVKSWDYAEGGPVLKLPKRATVNSAGYDFYLPKDIEVKPGETITVPTCIKCSMNSDTVLQIYPRSSLGFKYRLQLNNTVGIIDADYYNNPKNEGHIFVRMTNNGDKDVLLKAGDAFCQGIFMKYGKTIDDDTTEERVGGIGSTTK